MTNQESSIMMNIIFVSLFLGVVLLGVVVIIAGLNQGNVQAGQTISGSIINETIEGNINVTDSLSASILENPTCTINYVTDVLGNMIPSSNYTVNNCEVTYRP